jgi:hypothetical protein
MKNIRYILVLVVIFFLVSANEGQAQNIGRIYTDFRKLELYMVRVWELVQQFRDDRAVGYMIVAKAELDRARGFLYRSTPRYLQARIHMAKAKQQTDLAAQLVLSKPIYNLKSQLDDLINRAEQAVANSNSDEAHYLLNQAKKFRGLAYLAFNRNRPAKAQNYYRIAFFFGRKCLDYVKSSTTDPSEQFDNLETSVRQLLMQADELLMNSNQENLKRLIREAENYFQEALVLAEEGNVKMAITRLRLIKRLLYRVFNLAERGQTVGDQNRLENSLYTLRSLLEALDDEVANADNQRMRIILNKAWQSYREAEQAFKADNYSLCQGKISLGQRFANNLIRLTRSSRILDKENLEQQLQETRNMLNLQQGQVNNSDNPNILILYQEAIRMLERAQQALLNEKPSVAFQMIQAATRMSARIQRELRSTQTASPAKYNLEQKYQQIMQSLNNLEGNSEIQRQYQEIITQIKRFAEMGKQYLEEENLVLAEEYMNTAWQQLKQYTDMWRK